MKTHIICQFALCLISLFATFIVELVSFRLGTQYLKRRGMNVNQAQDGPSSTALHGLPETTLPQTGRKDTINVDSEALAAPTSNVAVAWTDSSENEPAGAQLLGVVILEFGILFHSVRPARLLLWRSAESIS